MLGYLLDTNHVGAVCGRNKRVIHRLEELPHPSGVWASVITLGEVAASHRVTKTTNQGKRDDYEAELERLFAPNALAISAATRIYYADVMAALFIKFGKKAETKTERWLVEICSVDINDVWITAAALEHSLTLLTSDTTMRGWRSILPGLKTDCWL